MQDTGHAARCHRSLVRVPSHQNFKLIPISFTHCRYIYKACITQMCFIQNKMDLTLRVYSHAICDPGTSTRSPSSDAGAWLDRRQPTYVIWIGGVVRRTMIAIQFVVKQVRRKVLIALRGTRSSPGTKPDQPSHLRIQEEPNLHNLVGNLQQPTNNPTILRAARNNHKSDCCSQR